MHGWDLARATGQPYAVEDAVLEAVLPHVTEIAEQGPVEGLFAAPVPVGENAPLPDRVIALTGRDPGWTPLAAQCGRPLTWVRACSIASSRVPTRWRSWRSDSKTPTFSSNAVCSSRTP